MKRYIKPSIKAVEIQAHTIIADSGESTFNIFDDTIDNSSSLKRGRGQGWEDYEDNDN